MRKLIFILLLLPVFCSSQTIIENVKEIVIYNRKKDISQSFVPNDNVSFIKEKEYFIITNATDKGDVRYKIIEEQKVHKQDYDTSYMKAYTIIIDGKKFLLMIFNEEKGNEIGIKCMEEDNSDSVLYR